MSRPLSSLATSALCSTTLCLAAFASGARADGLADDLPPAETGYRLGDGFHIPGTGFNIGGYATASYADPQKAPSRAAVDNASLFIWWEGDSRWKFFSELELENPLYTRSSDRGDIREANGYLSLERLYIDYALTDATDV
ncbi:MAG TPA: hypothetical protein VHQ21_16180, partial [Rhodanobacteraceae bacterium]|nr:hypothetical protein [Rhodanobacteraceae bacterium]